MPAIPIRAASTRLSMIPVPIVIPMISISIRTRRKFLTYFLEHVFTYTANRATPVIRKILKGSSRFDATVRITFFRVINITAGTALILSGLVLAPVLRLHCFFRLTDQ